MKREITVNFSAQNCILLLFLILSLIFVVLHFGQIMNCFGHC